MIDAYIPTVCPVHDFHSGTCSADCPEGIGWEDLGTLVSNVAGMAELVCAMKDRLLEQSATIGQLTRERDAAIALREDAEDKADVLAANLSGQIKNLREKREELQKGHSTLSKRIAELTRERDEARLWLSVQHDTASGACIHSLGRHEHACAVDAINRWRYRAEKAERERGEAQAKSSEVPGLTAALDEARWERDVVLGREPASRQALAEIARLVLERDEARAEAAKLRRERDLARAMGDMR